VRTRDPAILISLLASTTTPETSRKSADALLVEARGKTDPTRLGILEQLLYAPGHSDAMRVYALEQLADADPARAGRALTLYLPRFEGPVLRRACDLAVQLGDDRAIDPLVRSLERALDAGRGVEGGDRDRAAFAARLKARPEWSALEKLANRPVEETLYTRLAAATDRSVRTAALDLLPALQPPPQVKDRLTGMSARDPWFNDLQWWIASFDALPMGEHEMAWVQYLHRPERAALIARALERHRKLHPQPGTASPTDD
jgi:hypothetical protein